jgi:hypothetical protein
VGEASLRGAVAAEVGNTMSKWKLEELNERERACLGHLEQAKKLGLSFSRYCREKELSLGQWAWVKRVLVRKGVISERRRAEGSKVKAVGFAPVRIAPVAGPMTATTGCRIRHPSGWTIECMGYPEVAWLSALLSGEAR